MPDVAKLAGRSIKRSLTLTRNVVESTKNKLFTQSVIKICRCSLVTTRENGTGLSEHSWITSVSILTHGKHRKDREQLREQQHHRSLLGLKE